MMKSTKNKYPYLENNDIQSVSSLHFFTNHAKRRECNLYNKLLNLSYDEMSCFMDQKRCEECKTIMPMFDIEQKFNLKQVFNDLGMTKIFTPEAECVDPNAKYFVS